MGEEKKEQRIFSLDSEDIPQFFEGYSREEARATEDENPEGKNPNNSPWLNPTAPFSS